MAKTIKAAPVSTKPTAAPASTTDKGTVQIGGASMRFATTKDAGKVHVGGASMRF